MDRMRDPFSDTKVDPRAKAGIARVVLLDIRERYRWNTDRLIEGRWLCQVLKHPRNSVDVRGGRLR